MRTCVLFLVPFVVTGIARPVAAQSVTNAPLSETGVALTLHSASGGGDFCMDAKDDRKAEGTPIYLYRCNGRESQRWTVTRNQDGSDDIIGTGGFCLDVRGQTSRATGTPVQLWRCHFLKNQRFTIGADGRIKEEESGKCLQATKPQDGAPIVIDTCQNSPTEVWRFVASP